MFSDRKTVVLNDDNQIHHVITQLVNTMSFYSDGSSPQRTLDR